MQELGLDLYLQDAIAFILYAAWNFKMLWSPICSILGWRQRYRAPWIVLGNFMCVILSFSLMAPTHTIPSFVACVFLQQTFSCVADVNYDAVLSRYTKDEDGKVLGWRQTVSWAVRGTGFAIGTLCGPLLYEVASYEGVYGVVGALHFLQLVNGVFFADPFEDIDLRSGEFESRQGYCGFSLKYAKDGGVCA